MGGAEPVRAVFLDFDGLLVDTESVRERAWRELFNGLGVPFPVAAWEALIGSQGSGPRLAQRLAEALPPSPSPTCQVHAWDQVHQADPHSLLAAWDVRQHELLAGVGPRPGVVKFLAAARAAGLQIWVVSSATADWVNSQLARCGLAALVDGVTAGDGLPPKPSPDGYLVALRVSGADSSSTLAFEDSPHGVTAARAAGIRCVAVPNPVTARLSFEHADAVVSSFELVRLVPGHGFGSAVMVLGDF